MPDLVLPRSSRVPAYEAVYQATARPFALSKATGGAARFQFATLHHTSTAVRWTRIRSVEVAVESVDAACIVVAQLMRLTSATPPATGNPVITPTRHVLADPVSENVALALPTTNGSEAALTADGLIASLEWNLGITGAASTANPPPPLTYATLYSATPSGDTEQKPVLLKPGVFDGVAVTLDVNASATVKAFVVITFTEETDG